MQNSRYASATRVLEQPGKSPVLMVTPALLAVIKGPDKGKELEIQGRSVRVGSGPQNDLVLGDPAVSTDHFAVELETAGFLLRDLESTNGTLLDGYRVQAIYLPASCQVEVGQTRLRFTTSRDPLEIPLSARTRFGEMLGHSPAMRQIFAVLERVAPAEATVLLEGESGTGKELAARALHQASPRRGEPFIPVDCGALPPTLIESELFGHEKGAFTGASCNKLGLLEEANGGTLFLDEIGELPLDLQPKLLRALETRTIRRVGGNRPLPVDVRLIAATNRNLTQEVEAGRFRQDLFFRLSVIRVRLPPLRERREEIPRLVSHFMTVLGHDPSQGLPESLMNMLGSYRWPGNVRELRNVVERLVLLPGMQPDFYLSGAPGEEQPPAQPDAPLGAAVPLDLPFHEGKRVWTERFERDYLARLLRQCQGNISEVARVSGLSRQSCHRLLKRYALEP